MSGWVWVTSATHGKYVNHFDEIQDRRHNPKVQVVNEGKTFRQD